MAALADALAGSIGSCIAAILFFPLDTAKTRVQASHSGSSDTDGSGGGGSGGSSGGGSAVERSQRSDAAVRRVLGSRTLAALLDVYTREGPSALFRGLDAKVLSALSSGFIYFYAYAFLKVPVPLSLLTAALAGAINMLLTLPIDNVCTRLQTADAPAQPPARRDGESKAAVTHGETAQQTPSAVEAGDAGGDGNGAPQQQQHSEDVSVGGTPVATSLREESGGQGGAGGGDKVGGPAGGGRRKSSLSAAVADLHDEGGVPRFWRGLLPSMILTCNPAINYTAFDALKAAYLARWVNRGRPPGHHAEFLGPLAAFGLAAAAKAVATLVTYPLIRAKVIMMTRKRTAEQGPGDLMQCLADIARLEGLHGLYAGCGGQLLHTILKSALLVASREEVAKGSAALLQRVARRAVSGATRPVLSGHSVCVKRQRTLLGKSPRHRPRGLPRCAVTTATRAARLIIMIMIDGVVKDAVGHAPLMRAVNRHGACWLLASTTYWADVACAAPPGCSFTCAAASAACDYLRTAPRTMALPQHRMVVPPT
ncbi:mitochondrial carrier domain-containing protein [Tribonema minus]|uniref:Mitochondrial carrier domain-containing protein n=1 Tax=Tribonema minus TaxID=303371 RepID=A0A835YZE1_9STRA|nr:mitochondrial carrier domain-containing protein [Tribonema minus]